MKRIKFIYVFAIIVGLLFISGNVLKENIISIDKKNVSDDNDIGPYGQVRINTYFNKTDPSGNFLSNARFKMSTYNNVYSAYSSVESWTDSNGNNNQGYSVNRNYEGENVFNKAYNILSDKQKSVVDSIKTTNDFKKLNNGEYLYCHYYSESSNEEGSTEVLINNFKREAGYYCYIPLPTVYYLEETKAPSGYASTKVLLPGEIVLTYKINGFALTESANPSIVDFRNVDEYFNGNSYNVELIETNVFNYYFGYLEYGNLDINTLVGTNIDEAAALWLNNVNNDGCESIPSIGTLHVIDNGLVLPSYFLRSPEIQLRGGFDEAISLNQSSYCNYTIVDKKGGVNLEVSTTVNEKESVSTTNNSKLSYKVNVKNTGTVEAVDNIIISKLPEGFKYVEGTATNGGVYNAENNTITWTVYRINEGMSVELGYEAYAPTGLSSSKSYIGEASAQAFGMTSEVLSNKTTVRLMMNPKTSAPLYGIGITLIIMWGVAFHLYFDKRKKEVLQ